MVRRIAGSVPFLSLLLLASCAGSGPRVQDLARDAYPEAQAELRGVIKSMFDHARAGDTQSLKVGHLHSDKFTKFGGGAFERVGIDKCNEDEAAFFGTAQDLEIMEKDLKIDVFGDVAVMTYYAEYSYRHDGAVVEGAGRVTVVFLKTNDDWLIVHEHVTPKKCWAGDAGG